MNPSPLRGRQSHLKLPLIPQREDAFLGANSSMAVPLPLPFPSPLINPMERPKTQQKEQKQQEQQMKACQTVEAVHPEEVVRVCIIGKGNSGKVYKVRHRVTGKIYALKVLHEEQDDSAVSVQRRIHLETQILRRARSPYIVSCHGVSDSGGEISVVLEYMDGGSLAHILERRKSLVEPFIAAIGKQVLQGLLYLHANKIVHRDIKPSNLLINHKNQVKIADFGVSSLFTGTTPAPSNSFVGTCAYMSPERLDPDSYRGIKYDRCSMDIWSLGLSLLECFTGHFPFLEPGQKADWPSLMVAICLRDPPSPPNEASSEFHSFIKHCLCKDASARLTASQLLSHPFLAKYDENPCDLSLLMHSPLSHEEP